MLKIGEFSQMVLDEGYKTLLSGCWYINHLKYGQPWREYYDCDPVKSLPRSKHSFIAIDDVNCRLKLLFMPNFVIFSYGRAAKINPRG